MARCSICRFTIQPSEQAITCSECSAEYHQECWDEIGGCAAYGCVAGPSVREKLVVPKAVGKGWGNEKACPGCGKEIASSLLVCSCGARFPWAEPMSRDEYLDWLEKEDKQATRRRWILTLFLVSLFGVSAPLTGVIAGVYAFRLRGELGEQNGAIVALACGTAVIGLFYTLVFAATALGF